MVILSCARSSGDLARQRLENIPSARQTIDSGMGAENFIAPVVVCAGHLRVCSPWCTFSIRSIRRPPRPSASLRSPDLHNPTKPHNHNPLQLSTTFSPPLLSTTANGQEPGPLSDRRPGITLLFLRLPRDFVRAFAGGKTAGLWRQPVLPHTQTRGLAPASADLRPDRHLILGRKVACSGLCTLLHSSPK